MSIDEIVDLAEQDLSIQHDEDLGIQASQQPKLFSKYTRLLKQETLELKKLKIQADKLQSELWLYYTGKADPEVYVERPMDNRFLKSEVKEAIASDGLWVKHKVIMMVQEERVDLLERITQQIKDRGWSIKTILDWKRFISGD